MKIEISVDEVSLQFREAAWKIALVGGDPKNNPVMRKALICFAYLGALRQKYSDTDLKDQNKNALCSQFAEDHPDIADEFIEYGGDIIVSVGRLLEIRRQQIDEDLYPFD